MPMSMTILGIGAVSAMGCGTGALKAGLEGRAAPAMAEYVIDTAGGRVSVKAYTARVEGLERFLPRPALRRVGKFIQMALLSSFLAFEDAGVEIRDRTRVGIVFGSGYGPLQTTFDFLDTFIDFGDKCASPTLFANSVHNSLASQASILLKLQGPCVTLTCFERTTASVMSIANAWLENGAADYVLAGAGDEYCGVRGYATALSAPCKASVIAPFDFDDCTYAPGEGFAAFLLGKGRGGYCAVSVDEPDASAIADRHGAVLLAANGALDTGRFYRKAIAGKERVRAYSPLYGGMPTGDAFDVAIAAISLRDGLFYPDRKDAGAERLGSDDAIGCLKFDAAGMANLFTLSK